MERRAAILGTGHYLPTKVVTNDDLAQLMPTTHEWIHQRTGDPEARQRRPDAAPPPPTLDLSQPIRDEAWMALLKLHRDEPFIRAHRELRARYRFTRAFDQTLALDALGLQPGVEHVQWLLALPLRSSEGTRGVVFACGHGAPPAHSAAELERLATVGHWIGNAIADAERHHVANLPAHRTL